MTRQPWNARVWLLMVCAMMIIATAPGGFAQEGTTDDGNSEEGGGNATVEDNDAYPDADDVKVTTNRLVVDASTGGIIEWDDTGATLTDVAIQGVTHSDGFHLFDPYGKIVFANQSARSDGVVEFWWIAVITGTYTALVGDVDEVHDALDDADAANGTVTIPGTLVTRFTVPSGSSAGDAPQSSGFLINNVLVNPIQQLVRWTTGTVDFLTDSGRDSSPLVLTPRLLGQVELGTDPGTDDVVQDSGGGTGVPGGGGGGGSDPCSGAWWEQKETKNFWTPAAITHAPYHGSAEASSDSMTSKAVFVAGGAKSTLSKSGVTVPVENGQTGGVFYLAEWGAYQYHYKDPYDCETYTTNDWRAKVTNWLPGKATQDLYGPSKTHDKDDIEKFTHAGYSSIKYETKYRAKNDWQYTDTTTPVQHQISSHIYNKVGGSIAFSVKVVSFDVIELSASSSEGWSYEYDFPAGGHCWRVDHLGKGDSGGWAFEYAGKTSSC